jgi:DNA mismatch endonuclease, patch repair protein
MLKLLTTRKTRSTAFPDVLASIRQRMAAIKKVGTKPELAVRRCAHRQGYRFRLHRRDLPGTPDLVFPARKKVIFVNGCFWHQHDCHLGRKSPKTRTGYWLPKLARNVDRDKVVQEVLAQLGWSVLVLWECEVRDHRELAGRLIAFLGHRPNASRISTEVTSWHNIVTNCLKTVPGRPRIPRAG